MEKTGCRGRHGEWLGDQYISYECPLIKMCQKAKNREDFYRLGWNALQFKGSFLKMTDKQKLKQRETFLTWIGFQLRPFPLYHRCMGYGFFPHGKLCTGCAECHRSGTKGTAWYGI